MKPLYYLKQTLVVRRQAGVGRREVQRARGVALEKLGHAVDYLVDEQSKSTGPTTDQPQLAIGILCNASRRVYEQREFA